MMEHVFEIGDRAPDIVNVVIEIPKTPAMTQKLEVDLCDGSLLNAGDIDPPIPIHWHYGAIPQTFGGEGEALDVLVVADESERRSGERVRVRPIGVFIAIDGWETNDDKIIAVPDTEAHAGIREIGDLPPIGTGVDAGMPLAAAMNAFLARYRPGDAIVFDGWGNSTDARRIIRLGMNKYRCAPLARTRRDAHTFPLYQHIFVPPPPRHYGATHYLEDVAPVRALFEREPCDREYGHIVSGADLKRELRAVGYAVGRSRLRGHDRQRLVAERLRMADLMMRYGAKVFTASNDADWLRRARAHGVVTAHVDHEDYEVENVAGISAMDLRTIQYKRADDTHVAIVEHGVGREALKDRLVRIGVAGRDEDCLVFNVPDRLIPWEVPARHTRYTQLTNWVDYGFNIWPDRHNRPHLVIGEAVEKIARARGRTHELDAFIEVCAPEFEGVHILRLAEDHPYGAPTNSIDVGTAIISNTSLAPHSRDEMEEILQRPVDNTLEVEEDVPGLRCAVFPIDKSAYSILLEGDPLHHASVDRSCIDPLDPMDSFFDVHGSEHENLAARVRERREAMGEGIFVQNAVTVRRRRPPLHLSRRPRRHGPETGRAMRERPAVVILDWDNTLIDGTAYFAKVDAAVFDQIRREDGVAAKAPHVSLPGESDHAFFVRLLGSDALADKAAALFEANTRGGGIPVDFLPGGAELLHFLYESGIPHAIHSNSEDGYLRDLVRVTCRRAGLHVPLTVGITPGRIEKKPDPAGIHEVLRLLSRAEVRHAADSRVWIIGDSPKTDGMAGRAAGISVGLVPYRGAGDDDAIDLAHEDWQVFADLEAVKQAISDAG
ncbi:inorganic diphosphatase [Breoghania sp. JC706]|uniref:inorganic diphosphatase n=1 Tax=Breoghania sp. JC706 TaxID=3117732 RepID=UPI00300835DF